MRFQARDTALVCGAEVPLSNAGTLWSLRSPTTSQQRVASSTTGGHGRNDAATQPVWPRKSPRSRGGTPMSYHLGRVFHLLQESEHLRQQHAVAVFAALGLGARSLMKSTHALVELVDLAVEACEPFLDYA
jgi:hypothetical protein